MSDVAQHWETIYVYFFTTLFRENLVNLPDFTPIELETDLEKKKSPLILAITIALLGNFHNDSRKKFVNYTDSNWITFLKNVIDKRIHLFPLKSNPITTSSSLNNENQNDVSPLFIIDPKTRAIVLMSLCEWLLYESVMVRDAIGAAQQVSINHNQFSLKPIGSMRNGDNIWYIGPFPRVYQESGSSWIPVTSSVEDIRKFVGTLSAKKENSAYKVLFNVVKQHDENAAFAFKKQEEQKLKDMLQARRLERQLELQRLYAVRTSRRRNQVNYSMLLTSETEQGAQSDREDSENNDTESEEETNHANEVDETDFENEKLQVDPPRKMARLQAKYDTESKEGTNDYTEVDENDVFAKDNKEFDSPRKMARLEVLIGKIVR